MLSLVVSEASGLKDVLDYTNYFVTDPTRVPLSVLRRHGWGSFDCVPLLSLLLNAPIDEGSFLSSVYIYGATAELQ